MHFGNFQPARFSLTRLLPMNETAIMKKKVLIVEDDPVMGFVCQRLLNKHDYETEIAVDGAKGLERLTAFQPDAVLLDLMMPKVNGTDFLKGVRSQEPYRDLPIIVLTNAAVPTMIEQALKAGATKVLDKSKFNPVAVIELLRALLNTGPSTTLREMSQAQPWKG
jgi:CheY-like chemotaxis protein